MAFGDEGEAAKLPQIYCVGTVNKVSNLRDSKTPGSPYQVIDVEIEPLFAPAKRNYTFYFTFDPEWIRADVGPEVTESRMYRKSIASKGQTGALQGLLNGSYGELVEGVLEAGSATSEELFDFLVENSTGQTVGFVLEQSQDSEEVIDEDTGELVKQYYRTDKHQVGRFFRPAEVAAIEKRVAKSKGNSKIMWEAGNNPFGE